jgi:hypothetical protein
MGETTMKFNHQKIFILFLISSIFCLSFTFPKILAEPANKTALIEERNAINQVIANASLYMAESYNAFNSDLSLLGGIAYVDAVILDDLATQVEVDELTYALQQLRYNLVTKLIHASINLQFQQADTASLVGYTLRSQNEYHTELDRIEGILNDPRSGDVKISLLSGEIIEAHNLLVFLADKTELMASMTLANNIAISDGLLYTPNSFALFLSAHALFETQVLEKYSMTVNQIVNHSDTSVDEAEEALNIINNALSLLYLRPDKTELNEAYLSALSHDLSPYTPNSQVVFQNGLTSIKSIIDNPNTLMNDLEIALVDLVNLYLVLVPLADKSELIAANTLAMLAYYEERLDYTTSSYSLFKDAVFAYGTYLFINQLIADQNISQEDVNEWVETINEALSLLVVRADVTLLQIEYDQLLKINTAPYTPASIFDFEEEIDRIAAILYSRNTDQALADQTLIEAKSASTRLILLANTDELETLIVRIERYKESDYTATSYGYLMILYELAKEQLENPNVLQSVIDVMTVDIKLAISLLRPTLSPILLKAGQGSINLHEYIVVGNSFIVSYESNNPSILFVDDEGNIRGLAYGKTHVRVTLDNGLYDDIPVFVKANVQTATFVLVVTLPFVSAGIAIGLLSGNIKPMKIINKIKKI